MKKSFLNINKLLFYLLLLFIISISCKHNKTRLNLSNNEIISKIFTYNEIRELEFIIIFSDSIMFSNSESNNIDSAYHYYFEFLANSKDNYELKSRLAVDDSAYFNFVKKFKHKKIFNEIWILENGIGIEKEKDIYESLSFSLNGKYFSLLKEYSKINKYYALYYEGNKIIGDISPAITMKFIVEHKNFDFNQPINRLIAAIHLITIKYLKK